MIFRLSRHFRHLPVIGILLVLNLVMFRVVLPSDVVIQSNDYNYGLMAFYKSELPGSMFAGFWRDFPLLGREGAMPPGWNLMLLTVLPLETFMDWIYPIHLLTASGFLYAFLLKKGLSRGSSLVGILAAYWLGSNLTLILPGHLEKYAVLAWSAAALFALERLLEKPGLRRSWLLGGALGMMFLQQADLALFFGLLLGSYALFGFLTRLERSPKVWAKAILPLFIPAVLMMVESYRFSMAHHVDNVPVLQSEDSESRWNFITQWSWPPQESLDLVAPGFFGWYSGHPTSPYHGVMGQAPEFAETGAGQLNFKLESQYLGILPLGLAAFAIVIFLFRTSDRVLPRKEGFFWCSAFLLLFLLSCGKFTPLYRLFAELPLVGAIRNPNKFLQVFQVVSGILAAFGIEQWRRLPPNSRYSRGLCLSLCGVAVASMLGFLLTDAADVMQLSAFRETPWADAAETILKNRQRAWLHLSLLAAGGAFLFWFGRKEKTHNWIPWAIAVCCAVDGAVLAPHYLKPFATDFLKQNRLAGYLETHLGNGRVALLESSGIYSLYLTHLFPTRGIPFANISVAPRLSSDYQTVFASMVPDPDQVLMRQGIPEYRVLQGLWLPLMRYQEFQGLDYNRIALNQVRFWQEFGVSHVLARRSTWTFLQQWPGYSSVLQEVYAYRLQPNGEEHVVLALREPGPRAALIPEWKTASVDEVKTAIEQAERPLKVARVQGATIEPGHVEGSPGEVLAVLRGDRYLKMEVEVKAPNAFLRLSEAYSPHLRAVVNGGDPQPLLQTDILYSGLILPQGIHHIVVSPKQARPGVMLQWLGMGVSLLILVIPPAVSGIRYVITSDEDGETGLQESE